MSVEQLRQLYGSEYPAAIVINGVRLALDHEGRFARHYRSAEGSSRATLSRFQDGSARIEFPQFEREWSTWSGNDRQDFCMGCSWLMGQNDLSEMLRFIMKQPQADHWSEIALAVAHHLPQAEAFSLLSDGLSRVRSHTANLTQGIAATKHPEARNLLRRHLGDLWQHPDLWADDPFNNWTAFDATCCIAHLLELGDEPGAFEEKVRLLTKHPCAGNRDSCGTFLSEFYDWLPKPRVPPFAA